GGMGRVVLAERLSDGQQVRLKFLHVRTDRRMFEQECRALARLRHPAIIGLLDFSLDQNPPWMVTEYANGTGASDCRDFTAADGGPCICARGERHASGS